MAESLWDLTLQRALAETASAQPTPGGGSVAPISAALGLGLVLMALEITHAKRADQTLTTELTRGRSLLDALKAHADRDVLVFETYMRALGLPRQTEAEQALRRDELAAATLHAARTPLTAAETCLAALVYSESVAPAVQKNVFSDLLAGADLLHGALLAVLRTVEINLPALRDESVRAELVQRVAELRTRSGETYARIQAPRG